MTSTQPNEQQDFEKAVPETIGSETAVSREKKEATTAQARTAELESYNQQLRNRDRLLNCVNLATQCLVAVEDLSVALPDVLKILGEGTQQSRSYILKNVWNEVTQTKDFTLMLEWDAPGIPTKLAAGGRFPIAINNFPDHLTAPLKKGEATQFLARELDGIGIRDRIDGQARSLMGVPITVNGEWWGLLGLDDCVDERIWNDAEITVLKTAATAISSAIERTQARAARAKAEKAILAEREQISKENTRLLSSVAQMANLLLKATDYRSVLPDVVELLGKIMNCERCTISRLLEQQIEAESGYLKLQLLQEWCQPSAAPSPARFAEAAIVPLEGECLLFRHQLMKGEVVNFLIPDSEISDHKKSTEESHSLSSIMIVPIMMQGKYWGEISFNNCMSSRPYSEAETAILQVAAESIAAAVFRQSQNEALREAEKAVLEAKERAARDRAAELSRINEAISQTLTALAANPRTDVFLGLLLQEVSRQTGACKTHLYLYDAITDTLNQHCAVQNGQLYIGTAPGDPEMFSYPISASSTHAWQAILSSPLPLTFRDLEGVIEADREFWWPETIDWHLEEGHREVACSRMKVGDIPVGFICFAFRDDVALSPVQLEFIQALTNQATLSVHLTYLATQSQSAALSEERNRLAREIHDTLAQAFTGISLQLEAVRAMLHNTNQNATSMEAALLRARDLARKGLSEARRSVRALRSEALESDTLAGALRKMLSQTARDTGLSAQFYLEGVPIPIPDDVQLNLLRIAQEATTNVLRHAQATRLEITLGFISDLVLSDRPHKVRLLIKDNGIGFDPTTLIDDSRFGIVGIRERTIRLQGELDLRSTIGVGTTLTVTIPLRY